MLTHKKHNAPRNDPGRLDLVVFGVALMLGLLALGLQGSPVQAAPDVPHSPAAVITPTAEYQTLTFEENVGQAASTAPYVARGLNGLLRFQPTSLEMSLAITDAWEIGVSPLVTFTMRFAGANGASTLRGAQPLSASIHYYVGDDDRMWRSGVTPYRELHVTELYTGIDARIAGQGNAVKWSFEVAPQADPAQLRWSFEGVDDVALDAETGDLYVTFGGGAGVLTDTAPTVWQENGQAITPITASYTISTDGSIGLALGAYNPDLPLIIDPTLIYSTFWGGGQAEAGTSIALDSAGNACITGDTVSFAPGGFNDVYVSCFDDAGQWLYTTLVGGNSYEGGADLAFDASDQLYVTGPTWSSNFPATNGSTFPGAGDAFVLRINGGALLGSGALGGTAGEQGFGVATDAAGDVYVVGGTASTDFAPITAGTALYPTNQGGDDVFIVKLDSALSTLYGSYLGGSADDCDFYKGCEVATDATTGVYLTGNTDSADFPTLHAIQPFNGGGTSGWAADAFVTKLEWTGSNLSLVYSTHLGGTGYEESYGIAVDSQGDAVVVGTTNSTDFPTTPFALQPAYNGGTRDAYVSKLGWDGATLSLLHSSYLGGSNTDQANDVVIEPASDTIYVAGYTNSPDYPTASAPYPALSGSYDAFVTALHSNGATLVSSTYLGGGINDGANGIAVDATCDAYLTGWTASGGFPTQNPWNPFYQGNGDAFVSRLGLDCPITIEPNVNDITLNPGETFTEVLTVTVPAQNECVLDLYFLADTTGSMGSVLNTVRNSAGTILGDIAAELPDCDIAYGVGNYKDFPFDPYAFQHQQSLTTNAASAQAAITAWAAGGGSDTPEAQLYALYKTGQDAGGSIGWRANSTQRIVIWFGDAPAHDPVCQSIHGDATIPFDITLADTAGVLNGADVQVLAIDTANLNGTAWGGDYTGCPGNPGTVPNNSAQLLATLTGGAYQSGVNASNVVSTIVSQVTTLAGAPITVTLTSTGSITPYVSIAPAGGYGPLDPTISHTLPFTVTFAGVPCIDVEQVYTGTFDVVVDGEVVANKTVTITVPPCLCVEPPPDMVAWWPLDEPTGPWAYELVGAHNGYHIGGPLPATGMVSGSLDFDGADDYIRVANAPPLNFGAMLTGTAQGDFSIDAWIYPDNFANGEIPIVTKWDRRRGYYFFIIEERLSLVLADGTGASHYFAGSAPPLPAGTWTHVAVTVDRDDTSGVTFYVDGVPISTHDPTDRPGSLLNAALLTIGGTGLPWAYQPWRYFDGRIDEVEIFSRELAAAEVLDLYQAQSAGKCKPEPQPDLTIRKKAYEPFIVGGTGSYALSVINLGGATASGPITVTDTLPAGFVPPVTAGGSGWSCTVTGLTITCTHPGPLAIGDSLPPVIIHAGIGDTTGDVADNCAEVLNPGDIDPTNNTSCIETPVLPFSDEFPFSDLGDAPASDNQSGVGMTTYGSVVANFPTVFNTTIPGPLHAQAKGDAWLGIHATGEADADQLPDVDTITNLDPLADAANRDQADDGVHLRTVRLPRCRLTRFDYDASVVGGTGARYLNVWIDFNRDGDFADTLVCKPKGSPWPVSVPEWAVSNVPVSLSDGYHTGLSTPLFWSYRGSSWFSLFKTRWMRISLATEQAPAPGDGRGLPPGYRFGETEDHLLRFKLKPVVVEPAKPAWLVVQNTLGFSDTLEIPSQAVTRETQLGYFPVTAPLTETRFLQPVGGMPGLRFDIEAYRDDALVPTFTFERPLTLTMHYGTGLPAPALAQEVSSQPRLYRQEGDRWVEAGCGEPTYVTDEDKIVAHLCQSGEYALLTNAARQLYLPVTLKGQ